MRKRETERRRKTPVDAGHPLAAGGWESSVREQGYVRMAGDGEEGGKADENRLQPYLRAPRLTSFLSIQPLK